MKYLFVFLLPLLLSSCTKEGLGGEATIKGHVKHHSALIPNAIIHIKFGAKESPGTSASSYDESVTADANAYYEITGLKKGDYYLYGVGMDSAIGKAVVGGIPVEIKKRKEVVEADIPVTE